jgi:hypothetical protein
MSKCSHNRLKRKLIGQGKDEGRYTGYCSQQCKRMIEVEITTNDIREAYPKGRPKEVK